MFLPVVLLAAAPVAAPPVAPDPAAPAGYLYQPAFSVDYDLRLPARPYVPQPGDIYLATEDWFIARFGHKLVHSGAPHHSGIVFALPDGRMALLEGGPDNTLYIRALDLIPQITHYSHNKRVWIRRRCVPLTPEQSHRLTVFALATADKPFAAVRMVMENSPFRVKGLIRSRFLGKPYAATFTPENPAAGLREKYYCSELVTEACVAAGLMDPVTSRPPATYPRELFFGTSRVPYLARHMDMSAWDPPARWTPLPGTEPELKRRPWIDGDTTDRRPPRP